MPFSFNPGQEQTGLPPAASMAPPTNNNGVPALNVPVAPTISLAPVVEPISPFAYKNRSKSKFGVYLQSAIFLVFAVNLFAAVGLFAYQKVLLATISSKKATLDNMQKGFKKPDIEEMQKLSSRLSKINEIINERASVRTAFTVVEETISDTTIYNKFSLSKSKKDKNYDISFAGETNSYASLYQQIEILKSKTFAGAFPKISISGIGPLDKNGLATFKVDGSIAISGIDPEGYTVTGIGTSTSATSTISSDESSTTSSVEATSTLNIAQ